MLQYIYHIYNMFLTWEQFTLSCGGVWCKQSCGHNKWRQRPAVASAAGLNQLSRHSFVPTQTLTSPDPSFMFTKQKTTLRHCGSATNILLRVLNKAKESNFKIKPVACCTLLNMLHQDELFTWSYVYNFIYFLPDDSSSLVCSPAVAWFVSCFTRPQRLFMQNLIITLRLLVVSIAVT